MEDEIQAGEDGLYCVCFKNVFALNKEQILEAFSQYGRTHSVRGSCSGYERGWVFVRFANPEEAVRAITGMRNSPHLCDVNYVKYAQDRPGRRGGAGGGSGVSPMVRGAQTTARSPVRPPAPQRAAHHEVFVGNWPLELEKDDVLQLFTRHQIEPIDVRLYKKENKSYAFVVVNSAEEVSRATELLSGGKVAGRQIIVQDARISSAKPQQARVQPKPQPPAAVAGQLGSPGTVRHRLGGGAWRGGGGGRPGPRRGAPLTRMPALVMPGPDPAAGRFGGRGYRGAGFRPGPAAFSVEPDYSDPAGGHFNGAARYQLDGVGRQFEGGPFGGMDITRGRGAAMGGRRSYSQRDESELDFGEPLVKRSRFEDGGEGGFELASGPPPLAGLGRTVSLAPSAPGELPGSGRSSAAISERIKSRLHAPMDVVVANFPVGTNEHDLMNMFSKYEPLNVRIMVNNSSQHPDDFTYAYVTLSSRMAADEAVMEMDGLTHQGRPLVVETRKN